MKSFLIFLSAALSVDCVFGARILAVMPIAARSHHNMFHAVLNTLAERGHQVINYSPFVPNEQNVNYTHFVLDYIQSWDKSFTKEVLETLMTRSPVKAFEIVWAQNTKIVEEVFKNEGIRELLKSNETFDLIILEAFFAQETFLGLGHKYKAPVISLQPFGSLSLINRASGNDLALAHIPDFAFPYSNHMSFYERFLSSYSILSSLYFYYSKFLPIQEEYMKTVFKDPTMPPLVDMLHNISLFVNNAHPMVHYAQPYTPNLISVGGIHLSKERKPLPPAMKKFLDEAKEGVVYFSLGSIVPDHLLPAEFSEILLRVFHQLPQRVLWKTGSLLSNLPDNVMTAKWTPQQDVLAHANVVLFITHGGLFSQHEAINAGVPVVCVPFFADQPLNAKFYEERDIGVQLSFQSLSVDSILSAVKTVLNNPKYKENMKRLSQIYQDRPMSAADNLVFWVEYVLRHRGAPHLRPASSTLSWYQLALLDVVAAILATASLIILVVYLIMKRVVRLFTTTEYDNVIKNGKKTM